MEGINTSKNLQAETAPRDADRYSKTLQEYHRILWSKPLPNGVIFKLDPISRNRLYHKSDLGEFFLSSDRAVPSFSKWEKLKHITSKVPKKKIEKFLKLSNTIGGITVWPCNRIGYKLTINPARGFNRFISDRLDLSLECIRRYYLNEDSPLYETFELYNDFFQLFYNFKGYIDFFLFQDWVEDDYKSVKIAPPYDNFKSSPIPSSLDEYIEYLEFTEELIRSRNRRIEETE
jgi:hypothetical protein